MGGNRMYFAIFTLKKIKAICIVSFIALSVSLMKIMFFLKQKEIFKIFEASNVSTFIFLSSANTRGIAKYSKNLNQELKHYSIIFPFFNYKNKILLFLREQIINFLIMTYIVLLKNNFSSKYCKFYFSEFKIAIIIYSFKCIKKINLYIILHDAMEINTELKLNQLILKFNSILIYIQY